MEKKRRLTTDNRTTIIAALITATGTVAAGGMVLGLGVYSYIQGTESSVTTDIRDSVNVAALQARLSGARSDTLARQAESGDIGLAGVRSRAEAGNSTAQFLLGAMYGIGEGVAKNDMRAYFWLILAAAQGENTASAARDDVARFLSQEERRHVQALATQCFESNYQDCQEPS